MILATTTTTTVLNNNSLGVGVGVGGTDERTDGLTNGLFVWAPLGSCQLFTKPISCVDR